MINRDELKTAREDVHIALDQIKTAEFLVDRGEDGKKFAENCIMRCELAIKRLKAGYNL